MTPTSFVNHCLADNWVGDAARLQWTTTTTTTANGVRQKGNDNRRWRRCRHHHRQHRHLHWHLQVFRQPWWWYTFIIWTQRHSYTWNSHSYKTLSNIVKQKVNKLVFNSNFFFLLRFYANVFFWIEGKKNEKKKKTRKLCWRYHRHQPKLYLSLALCVCIFVQFFCYASFFPALFSVFW